MNKKCEELLGDSVINNRYPNKAKLIIRYLYFFSTVINTLWKTLSRLLWKNEEKFGAQKRH